MFRLSILIVFALAPLGRAAGPDDGWRMLKSLAGSWKATAPDGKGFRMSYQVISNNSAVMETMHGEDGSPFMVSIYHRDGADLMMTHYCAEGNQPRLKAASAGEKQIVFKFLDATNMSGPDADHINGLTVTFVDKDHMVQEWTSHKAAKDMKVVFKLARE